MQQKYANRRTKMREFAISDMVWLSDMNRRTKRQSKKSDHRFYRPLPVRDWVGKQA